MLTRGTIERWSGRLALVLVVAAVGVNVIRPPEPPPTTATTDSPVASLPEAGIEPVEQGGALERFADDLTEASSVLVLGDSTGNDLDEWVALWATDAADQREVRLHYWNADLQRFPPPVELGGSGDPLDVWNLSASDADATYAREFLGRVEDTPGAVVLSFGHTEMPMRVADRVRSLLRDIEDRWGSVPTALVLQNPSTTFRRSRQQATTARLARLARSEGLAVIDVYTAFDRLPAEELLSLLRDGTNPDTSGSRLWAAVVEDHLGVFGSSP